MFYIDDVDCCVPFSVGIPQKLKCDAAGNFGGTLLIYAPYSQCCEIDGVLCWPIHSVTGSFSVYSTEVWTWAFKRAIDEKGDKRGYLNRMILFSTSRVIRRGNLTYLIVENVLWYRGSLLRIHRAYERGDTYDQMMQSLRAH